MAATWVEVTTRSGKDDCPSWVNTEELTGIVYIPSKRELYLEGSSNNYTAVEMSEDEARVLVKHIVTSSNCD